MPFRSLFDYLAVTHANNRTMRRRAGLRRKGANGYGALLIAAYGKRMASAR